LQELQTNDVTPASVVLAQKDSRNIAGCATHRLAVLEKLDVAERKEEEKKDEPQAITEREIEEAGEREATGGGGT
jgi:hypothetical protein